MVDYDWFGTLPQDAQEELITLRAQRDDLKAALDELREVGRQMRDVLDAEPIPPPDAELVLLKFCTLIERSEP